MRMRTLCLGLSVAAVMYLFDPDRGRSRRAALVARGARMLRQAYRMVGHGCMDLERRAAGMIAEQRARMLRTPVSDDVLRERVRAELGHVVRHPHVIDVQVEDAIVRLKGHILPNERAAVEAALRRIPGVWALAVELDEHGWSDGRASDVESGGAVQAAHA